MLNDDGVAHSQPGAWTTARVTGVLNNEMIVGTSTSSKSSGGMGQPRRRLDSSEWTRVAVLPAMVSKAEFSLAQARLKDIHAGRMTTEELLRDLRRLLARHGSLSKPIIERYGRSSPILYSRRFGTLQAAFRLVGFERETRDYHHVEQSALLRENVLIGLKRLLEEKGRLSLTLINKVGYLPHGTTLIAKFGSVESLYEAVGYTSPHAHMLLSSRSRYRPRKSKKGQDDGA
jgi:Recombinase